MMAKFNHKANSGKCEGGNGEGNQKPDIFFSL